MRLLYPNLCRRLNETKRGAQISNVQHASDVDGEEDPQLCALPIKKVQSCVNLFLLSFENHSQNVPLPTPKLYYGAIFQLDFPKT